MTCMSCKMEDMYESKNAYFVQLPDYYVIIENVPCYKCKQCGEIFYKTSVLEKIDELVDKIEDAASRVLIMDYSQAA